MARASDRKKSSSVAKKLQSDTLSASKGQRGQTVVGAALRAVAVSVVALRLAAGAAAGQHPAGVRKAVDGVVTSQAAAAGAEVKHSSAAAGEAVSPLKEAVGVLVKLHSAAVGEAIHPLEEAAGAEVKHSSAADGAVAMDRIEVVGEVGSRLHKALGGEASRAAVLGLAVAVADGELLPRQRLPAKVSTMEYNEAEQPRRFLRAVNIKCFL